MAGRASDPADSGMTVRSPFYPAQVESGETYVVDGRTNKVVHTVSSPPDTTVRWALARSEANRRNAAYVRATYATRQRLTVALLTLLAVLVALELGTGDLSALVHSVITSRR